MELVVKETIPKVGSSDELSCAEYSELENACQSPPPFCPPGVRRSVLGIKQGVAEVGAQGRGVGAAE